MRKLPLLLLLLIFVSNATAAERPNILIITVDDMNCDSVGAFGCRLPGTTPHIDRLASQGMRFQHAHVQVGNCFPSRNVLLSGRYPHNTGVEGFYQVKDAKHPHLVDLMKAGGSPGRQQLHVWDVDDGTHITLKSVGPDSGEADVWSNR